MEKFALVITCIAAGCYSLAGMRINGPVGVLDAEGESKYHYIDIHDIVGEVDCIQLVGCKSNGLYEIRRYLKSADPKCIMTFTNITARTYETMTRGEYCLRHRHGLDVSLMALSETNRVLVVAKNGETAGEANQADAVDAIDWHSNNIIDNESGLSYWDSCRSSFIDGSTDSLLVSLYASDAGAVKIWYEVVDVKNTIKAKGWVSGVVKDDNIVEQKEYVVLGSGGIRTFVMLNTIPSLSISHKNRIWLAFGVQVGGARSNLATLYL